MFSALRTALLQWLRVPHTPEPPAGSPDSIQIFHAGANLYKLGLLKWALTQCALTIPILALFLITGGPRSPQWFIPALRMLRLLAISVYAIQFLLTYAALRLNFEMRWYIVTDRSLRIRSGIWSVKELTMTFANIQQVNLTRGPLQGLLGIADLEVSSAGGKVSASEHGIHRSSHAGRFEGVDNAEAIRDLILDRLKHYREAGLGDPDDHHMESDPIAPAQEVLQEVRNLRALLNSDF